MTAVSVYRCVWGGDCTPVIGFQYDPTIWQFNETIDRNGHIDVVVTNNYDTEQFFVLKIRNDSGDVTGVEIYKKHVYHYYEISSGKALRDENGNRVKDPYTELPQDKSAEPNPTSKSASNPASKPTSKSASNPASKPTKGNEPVKDSSSELTDKLQYAQIGLTIAGTSLAGVTMVTKAVAPLIIQREVKWYEKEEGQHQSIRDLAAPQPAVVANPVPAALLAMPAAFVPANPAVRQNNDLFLRQLQHLNLSGLNRRFSELQLEEAPNQQIAPVQNNALQMPAVVIPLTQPERQFAISITTIFKTLVERLPKLALSAAQRARLQAIQPPLENLSKEELVETARLIVTAIKNSYRGSGRSALVMREKAKKIQDGLKELYL